MKCAICRSGDTHAGRITVLLEREGTTLVFKDVPADICDNCGEEFLAAVTNRRLLEQAERAFQSHASLELLRYAA